MNILNCLYFFNNERYAEVNLISMCLFSVYCNEYFIRNNIIMYTYSKTYLQIMLFTSIFHISMAEPLHCIIYFIINYLL